MQPIHKNQEMNDTGDRLENFKRTKDLSLLNPPIEFEKNVLQYNAYWKRYFYRSNSCCCLCCIKAYNDPNLMSGPVRLAITPEGIESVDVAAGFGSCGFDVGAVITKSIPFDKMQDIGLYSDRFLSDFNLKRLDIETSGSTGAEVAAMFLMDPDGALAVIKLARDAAEKQKRAPTSTGSVSNNLRLVHTLVQCGALQPAEADFLFPNIVAKQSNFCDMLMEAHRLATQGDGELRLTQQQFDAVKAALIRELK